MDLYQVLLYFWCMWTMYVAANDTSLFVDFLLTTIVYKILQQIIGDDLKKDLEERKEWSKPAPWIKADKSKSCVF